METLHSYRPHISIELLKEFEKAAKKVISKQQPTKLGFIALMIHTDRKEHHDIDVIIFPNKKAKIGEAMVETVKFYDSVEKELKKKNERYYLATCPKMAMQQLAYYLSSLEEGSAGLIPVHSMFFPDYKSFIKISPARFWKKVENGIDIIPLFGSLELAKEISPLPQSKLEPYFFVLDFELSARIKTFPRHLVRSSAQHLFEYLKMKYNLNSEYENLHHMGEIEKAFIKLMKKLDKITYS